MNEIEKIKSTYRHRNEGSTYAYCNLEVMYETFSRHKCLAKNFKSFGVISNMHQLKLLDVGSGFGDSILEFIRMGFSPDNITGVELMKDRYNESVRRLPSCVTLFNENFLELEGLIKYDIIYVSLVFTSLLSDELRHAFAKKIISNLNCNGLVIIYDFEFDNPFNNDVRKFNLADIEMLFKGFSISSTKTTILPHLSRFVSKFSPFFLPLFSFITTHRISFLVQRN